MPLLTTHISQKSLPQSKRFGSVGRRFERFAGRLGFCPRGAEDLLGIDPAELAGPKME